MFIKGVITRKVDEAQIGAMLMAMYLRDLSISETTHLTRAMVNSGDTLSWPADWKGLTVDKHSTGGVGDKISLVLAPALAACGMKVPMISGRGLGHTGGTLDKMESIPGYSVSVTTEQMLEILETVGCCIVGQTAKLCPADRILYAIRDVTGTVDHIGLITASIVSKKVAENVDALVLDVKYGNGAFMQDIKDSRLLAERMVASAKGLGTKAVALLTGMDYPLGNMIGNSLEVVESIQCLQGDGPEDIFNLTCQLGGHVLNAVGKTTSASEGFEAIKKTIEDGSALRTFCSMLKSQGVKPETAEALCAPGTDWTEILPQANSILDIKCPTTGYVSGIHARTCAEVAQKLGAGRSKAGEKIDHAVGLQLLVKIGDQIQKDSPWVKVHVNGNLSDDLRQELNNALTISSEPVSCTLRVNDVIS